MEASKINSALGKFKMNKKLIILLLALVAGGAFGIPKYLTWNEHKNTLALIDKAQNRFEIRLRKEAKKISKYSEYYKLDKLALEHSQSLVDEFGKVEFVDIKAKVDYQLKVDSLLWGMSKEKKEMLDFFLSTRDNRPDEVLSDVENIIVQHEKAYEHFLNKRKYVLEKRKEFAIELEGLALEKKQREQLWEYIDNRTTYLLSTMDDRYYKVMADFMGASLAVYKFLKLKKDEVGLSETGLLKQLTSDDHRTISGLMSDLRRAKFNIDFL